MHICHLINKFMFVMYSIQYCRNDKYNKCAARSICPRNNELSYRMMCSWISYMSILWKKVTIKAGHLYIQKLYGVYHKVSKEHDQFRKALHLSSVSLYGLRIDNLIKHVQGNTISNVLRHILCDMCHSLMYKDPGPRLNIKTVLSTYGDFHVKDKTAVRTSYL